MRRYITFLRCRLPRQAENVYPAQQVGIRVCRCVSSAHVLIFSPGPYAWQYVYDVLNDAGYRNIPGKETYGKAKDAIPTRVQDNSKSLRIFPSLVYRTLSESVRDMGDSLAKGGFL